MISFNFCNNYFMIVFKHTINVLFNKQHIPNSPFILDVYDHEEEEMLHEETIHEEIPKSPLSINKYENVVVWGRGLLPVGTSANEELCVYVDNCEDEVVVSVKKGLEIKFF